MTKQEKAIELHDRDATVHRRWRAFAEEIGVPEETLFAAAEGFGLGMGGMEGNLRSGLRCGNACGLQEQLCRS